MENSNFKSLIDREKVKVPFEAPKHYFDEFPTKMSNLIAAKPKPELIWMRFIRLAGLPIGFATILIIALFNFNENKNVVNEEIIQEYIASEAIEGVDEFSFIDVDYQVEPDSLTNKKVDI